MAIRDRWNTQKYIIPHHNTYGIRYTIRSKSQGKRIQYDNRVYKWTLEMRGVKIYMVGYRRDLA